jgi:ribosomal protein S18 acetylase RimI-like enzyme
MQTLLELELGVWVTLRNGEPVLIRRFRRTDGDALYEFFTQRLSPESQRLYSLQPLDRNLVEWVVSEADAPDVVRLVAFKDDAIIGYAYWRPQIFKPKLPLQSIAVADEYQGLGLGRALMELLIDAARLRDMDHRAIALYRKVGFEIVGDTDAGRQWVMVLKFRERWR